VFIGIVIFHAFLIYGIATGLVQKVVQKATEPFVTKIINDEKPPEELPPPPPPEMERPPVQIVVPDINIPVTADAPPPPIQNVTTSPVISQPPPPVVAGTAAVATYFPSAAENYPPLSRDANEEGRPEIKICVASNGKVDSVDLTRPSGFDRLDEAAVKMGKASRWKPATQAGKPIAFCKGYAIKFQLDKNKK
jgi:protein TonB